mmetsp:Transcript_29152/g.95383  ORF Transcript_29152/g.95383 Transcript_29152/m.95383 type:complete len:376 (-) Transcript_29152:106-1233(-)
MNSFTSRGELEIPPVRVEAKGRASPRGTSPAGEKGGSCAGGMHKDGFREMVGSCASSHRRGGSSELLHHPQRRARLRGDGEVVLDDALEDVLLAAQRRRGRHEEVHGDARRGAPDPLDGPGAVFAAVRLYFDLAVLEELDDARVGVARVQLPGPVDLADERLPRRRVALRLLLLVQEVVVVEVLLEVPLLDAVEALLVEVHDALPRLVALELRRHLRALLHRREAVLVELGQTPRRRVGGVLPRDRLPGRALLVLEGRRVERGLDGANLGALDLRRLLHGLDVVLEGRRVGHGVEHGTHVLAEVRHEAPRLGVEPLASFAARVARVDGLRVDRGVVVPRALGDVERLGRSEEERDGAEHPGRETGQNHRSASLRR